MMFMKPEIIEASNDGMSIAAAPPSKVKAVTIIHDNARWYDTNWITVK
jgi:hypothetical protein